MPSNPRVKPPRKVLTAIGVVLAVAVVLFLVWPHPKARLVRRSTGSGFDSLVIVAPTDVTPGRTKFIWSSVEGATLYELKLTGPDGATVWSYHGSDTTAVVPDSVGVTRSTGYVWTADALMQDGTHRSTRLRVVDY